MSTLSQFFGARATKSVVHAQSSGTPSAIACTGGGEREVLGGAMTAATLKTMLSITGAGEVPVLSAYAKNATSRTIRCRVTVDGTVVFDVTSSAIVTTGNGLLVSGLPLIGSNLNAVRPAITFNSSLIVEVASSLTETDLVAIGYTARTY